MRAQQTFFLFLAIIFCPLAICQELIPPVSKVGKGPLLQARQIFALRLAMLPQLSRHVKVWWLLGLGALMRAIGMSGFGPPDIKTESGVFL